MKGDFKYGLARAHFGMALANSTSANVTENVTVWGP